MRAQKMRENPLCIYCQKKGVTRIGKELDHIVPVSLGGSNEESNLQLLCFDCHAAKTILDLGQKPKPKIGLDGWPESDENFPKERVEEKSKHDAYKTVLTHSRVKTSGKRL